ILQKVLSSTTGKVVASEEVERITGAPKTALVNSLLTGIASSDTSSALQAIRAARDENVDMKTFAKLLLRKLRAAKYVSKNPGNVCPASWEPGEDTLEPGLDLVGKL
ncbi:MAG: hypothetical protein B7W96_00485, partial [Parcubacteria group bacterium 37-58-5]